MSARAIAAGFKLLRPFTTMASTASSPSSCRVPLHLWRQYEMLSLAPMLDVGDRHFRWMLRQLSKHTPLYSEMVVDSTLVHSPWRDVILTRDESEEPVILQLGGSNPEWLAQSARMVAERGYAGVNLNCGCPSPKVAGKGAFGAALMLEPELVRECVLAMRKAAPSLPISVKCRLGVDEMDDYEQFKHFIRVVSEGGACNHFIIHSRKALLKGLSPKDNRTIPPLRYHWVQRLSLEFPHLRIGINGGIGSLVEAAELLMLQRTEPKAPLALVDTAALVANAALGAAQRRADGTATAAEEEEERDFEGGNAARTAVFKGKREYKSKAEYRWAKKKENEQLLAAQEEVGLSLPWNEEEKEQASHQYPQLEWNKPKAPCCEADEEDKEDEVADAGAVGGAGAMPESASPEVKRNPLPRTKAEALKADDGFPKEPMKQVWPGVQVHPAVVKAREEAALAEPFKETAATHYYRYSFQENMDFTRRMMKAMGGSSGSSGSSKEGEMKQWPGILHLAHLADPSRVVLESVMIGRALQTNPWILADADRLIFGEPNPVITRRELIERYCCYVEALKKETPQETQDKVISLYSDNVLVKPLLPLFTGCHGGKRFAAVLSQAVIKHKKSIREACEEAMALVPAEALDELPPMGTAEDDERERECKTE